jgi:hypothetical protein
MVQFCRGIINAEIPTDKILLKNGGLHKSQIESNDFKNEKSILIRS